MKREKSSAKKSLGQNFLSSEKILAEIVAAAALGKSDLVLEIGPGRGSLTKKLLSVAGEVVAVEKDNGLISFLKEKFREEIAEGKLTLISGDILDISVASLGLSNSDYSIVANIPYYITGELLRRFLSAGKKPQQMVLLVQKEVARRIVASDKKESVLSLSVKAYGNPKYVKTIPARCFKPTPKVDSALLTIKNISKYFFKDFSEQDFFKLIKAGFSHKRKKLIRNLEVLFKKEKLDKAFETCGLEERARAEDLGLGDWASLLKTLN